jgi:hypothetical protein
MYEKNKKIKNQNSIVCNNAFLQWTVHIYLLQYFNKKIK